MTDPDHLRLRLQSCIDTVLEIHQVIATARMEPDMRTRFEELRRVLASVQTTKIDEAEVRQVEEATEHLLGKLTPLINLLDADPRSDRSLS